MATHTKWLYTFLAALIIMICANPADADGLERVRSESILLRTVIATAFEHSATFRSLLARIEQSDVIVYLTCHRFDSGTLSGRTALATALPGVRYVRVQVRCQQSEQMLVAIVAHELQHVVEIAASDWVVNGRTLRRLFSAIGFQTCLSPDREQFETMTAIEIGDRVRAEYRMRSKIAKQAKVDADLSASRSDRASTRIAAAK
jgi:hypothetical protein